MIIKNNKIVFGLLSLALSACGSDSDSNEAPNTDDSTPSQTQTVSFEFNGIESMSGQHYEGWIITADGAKSTGRFNINGDGAIVSVDVDGNELSVLGQSAADFEVNADLDTASTFVLTIEPNGDTDPSPSSIHYVGGNFSDGETTAVLSHASSIAQSFNEVTGSFFLATPTNGASTHNQGVWYIEGGAASLASLPSLDSNWLYEGWVVNTSTGEVVSTGTFSSPSGADSDGAGVTAGPNAAPPFPGQDYINPAKILNDGSHMMVISVEPSPDFDPKPFTLKPLGKLVPEGAAVTTTINLDNISNENDIWIKVKL